MKPRRRPAAALPVSALMALVVLVVAVVMVFGAFQQQSANERRSAEVVGRDKLLDQREAALDQRRSELNRRDGAARSRELALDGAQQALDGRQAELDGRDAALVAREQALEAGVQALEDGRASLAGAEGDLKLREQALQSAQAETDAKLRDCAGLQEAVDGALGARTRIAAKLSEALGAAGLAGPVDGEGGVSLELGAVFNESSAVFTKGGRQVLDAFLPVWYGTLGGEGLAALSVEVLAPPGDPKARELAARRAAAIVQYASDAPALDEALRAAFRDIGLSGVRPGAAGETRAVFRFHLNGDALRRARTGR